MTASLEGAAEIIARVDHLRAGLDALRPLAPEVEARALQKLRLDWNYHSNAIEGNSLTYGETMAFLMHGVTAKGKPLKDYLDIRGHDAAIKFLVAFVRDQEALTEKDIRDLHALILAEPYEVEAITPDGQPTRRMVRLGEYKTAPNHVRTKTGEMHYFASPAETPIKMGEMMVWLRESAELHPLIRATRLHHTLAAIHPFDDGNGRVARLLMNLVLMQAGYPPAVIRQEARAEYYGALAQADAGQLMPLVEVIGEAVVRSLEVYRKAALGESIDEPDDLDKEIALLKREVESRQDKQGALLNDESRRFVFERIFTPLWAALDAKLEGVAALFDERRYRVASRSAKGSGSGPSDESGAGVAAALTDRLVDRVVFTASFCHYRYAASHFDVALELQVSMEERASILRVWAVAASGVANAGMGNLDRNVAPIEVRLPHQRELSEETLRSIVDRGVRALLAEIRRLDGSAADR